jgi:hypothetical protein
LSGSSKSSYSLEYRSAARATEIAVFDFLSHDHVHLAFNEGYLRVLSAAYPRDRIWFCAGEGHVERLAPSVADLPNIQLRPCRPFETSFGLSHHNPIAGRWAARRCLYVMAQKMAPCRIRFAALLGINANLLAVVGRRWPSISPVRLHMILHGQLGEAMIWRSRNPLIRASDLISQLKRPLPKSVQIVALELGVKEAITAISQSMASSIVTLEHPILTAEWANNVLSPKAGKIRIGFAGHARRAKGFDLFVELASRCSRNDIEFHAIGLSSPETDDLNTSALARKPSPTPLPRKDYLKALEEVDLVCLPLHSRAYDFTASGTICDAVAALKPLIAFRTGTLDAIASRYGSIGWLVDDAVSLFELIETLDTTEFARQRPHWINNLKAIRESRSPQALAKTYVTSLIEAEGPGIAGRPQRRVENTGQINADMAQPR